jgi:hypothetical protein
MKVLNFLPALLILAACNNSSNSSADSVEHGHDHAANTPTEETVDTTAISPDQSVYFANLKDGQSITLPFVVEFGVKGMEVEPAQGVNENKGHHHLFIDQSYTPASSMVPMGKEAEGYYHFGKGQLSDTLSLSKYPMLTSGKHTLRLQFANGLHMSYGPAMSTQISVEVK